MSVPLLVAGSLACIGAAIHGGVGEALVVRKLSPAVLPSSPFGGPATTKRMIQIAWHMATIGLLTVGATLLLAGSVLDGDTGRAVGLVGATAATGFAALVVGFAVASARSLRPLFGHPGPLLLTATAVLAWWGAL